MAAIASVGPPMLVVPVSMAAIVPLPIDMAVPWTVNAVGRPVSRGCSRSDKDKGNSQARGMDQ